MSEDGGGVTIRADAPLAQMFGYSTDLRSITQVGGDGCLDLIIRESWVVGFGWVVEQWLLLVPPSIH